MGLALAVAIWVWPLLNGRTSLRFRDLGTTQVPATQLFGRLRSAAINPYASFGQPYAGNPNLVTGYRFLISWLNSDAHIALHWVVGFVGMCALLRRFRASPNATFLGAVTFSFSGYVLSSLSFLNATTTIGLMPWVLWAAVGETANRWTPRLLLTALLAVFSISGEPALIVLGVVVALLVAARASWRHLVWLLGAGAAALLSTLSVHMETLRAARDSTRLLRGFSFGEAAAQSLHPARLLEWVLPGVFGTPSTLLKGAWWGFRFSGEALPYIHSVAFLFVSLILLVLQCAASWRSLDRFWMAVFAISVSLSMYAYIPFAGWFYEHVVHYSIFRYPIKFVLVSTVAMAVLTARSFDFWVTRATPRQRTIGVRIMTFLTMVCGLVAVATIAWPRLVLSGLRALGWDDRWNSDPLSVLQPIVDRMSGHFFLVAVTGVFIVVVIRRASGGKVTALLLLMLIEAVSFAPLLIPTVATIRISSPSGLLKAAANMQGPVCELAAKDLDPVRFGLQGHYAVDAAGELAVVQARQAWAISGAPAGVRYAYNNSPDGSYTLRNQLVQEDMERHHDWSYELKWFRASGVAGVIAPAIEGEPDVEQIAVEDSEGIPVKLYRITDTLASIRRTGNVVWAQSSDSALRAFDQPSFDERSRIIVESRPMELTEGPGVVTVVHETPDRITIGSSGPGQQVLFVARSFTRNVVARVDGRVVTAFPANVHLTAIVVPPGSSTAVISF